MTTLKAVSHRTSDAVHVVTGADKALVSQGQAALLAGEAILVPGELLVVQHFGAAGEPCGHA